MLQNDNPVDDGSMSVYAFRNGKRYINAEAKMGRVKEQVENAWNTIEVKINFKYTLIPLKNNNVLKWESYLF